MLVLDVSPEEYVDNLLSEKGLIDPSLFDDSELAIIEDNEAIVRQDDFEVCFVSEPKILNQNSLVDEETIVSIWTFLWKRNIMEKIELSRFVYAINHKKLPDNGHKILWTGTYADARRLVDFFGFNDDIFNACFDTKKGKPLDKKVHKLKENDTSDFLEFLIDIRKSRDKNIL